MPSMEEIIQAVHIAAAEYPVERVDLFGSYADGTADEQSDLDFLVRFSDHSYSLMKQCGFQEYLQELLNIDVDVVRSPAPENEHFKIGRRICVYGA